MGLSVIMIGTVVCAYLAQLRAQKVTSIIAYLLSIVAFVLYVIHCYFTLKENKWTINHASSEVAKPKLLDALLKFAGAVSLAMCFFDGNHKILLLKAEMAHPNDFMKIVGIAHAVFAFVMIAFGAATHLILG